MTHYTFGDTELAAERLRLLARVFDPASARFLRARLPVGLGTVVDLGCGPGTTTRLIAEVSEPRRVVGIDSSAAFLDAARKVTGTLVGPTTIAYVQHDATELPLPEAPVDAIYARMLLAHLPDPLVIARRWQTQLSADGLLLLDDVQDIEAPDGPLASYEDLVVRLVGTEGGLMYAGRALAPLGGDVVDHRVMVADAAAMFAMNLRTWRARALDAGLATRHELDGLADRLDQLATSTGGDTVRWTLRQVAVSPDQPLR
ncbi:MAG TPA: class I SAM-dependent methyltransferase [Nitriliruptorales bacterium]